MSSSPSRAFPRHASRALRGAVRWVTVVALLVVAAAWLFPYDLDRSSPRYDQAAWAAFLVRSLGVQLSVVTGILLLVALLRRQWFAMAILAAVTLFLAWPTIDLTETTRPPRRDSIRVMSANLLYSNTDVDRVLAQVARIDPDVLLLQEYTPRWHADLRTRLGERYPYVADDAVLGSLGVAMYSKLPFARPARHLTLGDSHKLQARAVVRVHDRDVAIYDIHLTVPMRLASHVEQRRQVARLAETFDRERLPMIAMGDMNFTETSRHHAAIIGAGVRSGWDDVGRGRGSTWNRPGLPAWLPGLRLDHLFVSDDIAIDRMRIGGRTGSDHRPIYADVRINDA